MTLNDNPVKYMLYILYIIIYMYSIIFYETYIMLNVMCNMLYKVLWWYLLVLLPHATFCSIVYLIAVFYADITEELADIGPYLSRASRGLWCEGVLWLYVRGESFEMLR